MKRQDVIDSCAASAHEAWLMEKRRRLLKLGIFSWPNETGVEQLVHWEDLPEEVREFDRIVVAAIIDEMAQKGIVVLDA